MPWISPPICLKAVTFPCFTLLTSDYSCQLTIVNDKKQEQKVGLDPTHRLLCVSWAGGLQVSFACVGQCQRQENRGQKKTGDRRDILCRRRSHLRDLTPDLFHHTQPVSAITYTQPAPM